MDPLTSGLIGLLAIVIGGSVYALQQMNERINQLQLSSFSNDAIIEDDMTVLSNALSDLIDEADASRRLMGSDTLLKSQQLIESLNSGSKFELSMFNVSLRSLLSSFQESSLEEDLRRLESIRRDLLSSHIQIIQENNIYVIDDQNYEYYIPLKSFINYEKIDWSSMKELRFKILESGEFEIGDFKLIEFRGNPQNPKKWIKS